MATTRQVRSLRIQSIVILLTLVLQYAFGMYVNLFVQFPEHATQGQLWEFSWSQKPLAFHIILAILLLIGAIVFCIRTLLYRNKKWIMVSFVGLLSILAAGTSGAVFIPSQKDAYSYVMSLFFLLAFLSYAWGVIGLRE